MKYNNQKGVGLVEVLVALFLLAVAVLGFAALQLRAVDASLEASKQVLALTIARDLAERMRANPQAVRDGAYVVGAVSVPTSEVVATVGDAASIAKQDLNIAALNAKNNGMNLSISECLMCAELAGDFHLGDSRQLTDKSLLPFDLVS
ncbi:type IV pilus modification protein PilV [Acinetobacter haemolyticus]|uniref:type IV pilus modification protein PilV n=1 Tax=Acinetobacter haemolyticus TaxID=29430 RepID=UPI00209160CF|nr:type IV pilus modification protein PilV [Acinetobacter haemolyticus]